MAPLSGIKVARVLSEDLDESRWVETGSQKLAQLVEKDHFSDRISETVIKQCLR